MKNINQLILAAVLVFSTCLNAAEDQLSQEEKEAIVSSYKYWKSIGSGIGSNAIKSPFGRYLILKNKDSLLCLKLEKHLPSVTKQGKAARYSWVHMVAGKKEDSGTFEIDEDGCPSPYLIELAEFKCEWSFGDWVYFDENLPEMKMAVTGLTDESELEELDIHKWFSKSELEAFGENDPLVELLEKALDTEQGGAGQRR